MLHSSATGPSSTPAGPIITAGPVTAPVIRTGLQAVSAGFIAEGIDVWNVVHWTPSQRAWTVAALSIVLSAIQNAVESWRGRRLIGTPRPGSSPLPR